MKPASPTSIRFSKEHKQFLKRLAKAQGHANLSQVVKRLVAKEMNGTAH